MARLNNILKQRLAAQQVAQPEHPSADTLAAFAEQNLRAPQRETVLRHLAACVDCRQAVMLATSEVPVEQAAATGLSRKPGFQFPAAMRWASLAAALAVAVGVGLLLNEHDSAKRQAGLQETVGSVSASPSTQPAQEAAKQESETKNSEAKNDLLKASPVSKPTPLNEKKKASLATSYDRANLSPANAANSTAAPSASSAGNTRRLDDSGLNQETANAFAPNRDSDQKVAVNAAKNAPAVQTAPTPSLPPSPAAGAFYGPTSDNLSGVSGGVARSRPAPAFAKQKVEVLQGAVTDPSGAAVAGAALTIKNVATGETRVVQSGADGSYRVDPIPAGIYKIEVASPGFTTATAERVEALVGASTTQNFQLEIGSATETVAVVSQNVSTTEASVTPQAPAVQIPSKAPSAAAVSGSLREARSTRVRAGIANWAISDTGQLQRTLSDGATANVQPASGMTVRAVAAEGIEVWAAGTQTDATARELTRSVLFHSSDAGKTWSRVDGPWQATITQLSLSGKGNLVVTTQNGAWATNDAGKTWVPVKTKG